MIRADLAALPAYVPGKRQDGATKLSSNETTQPPLPAAVAAMRDVAAGANRYPDMGAIELRTELADHLGLSLEQIAVGTGSSALCQQLVQITSTVGDEVVFPWRSFEAYPLFAQVVGATPVAVPLKDDGVDLEAMAAAITERTRLVFVCNPNNPTGTTVTSGEFIKFLSKVPSDVIVALDEAYFEYNKATDTPVATDFLASHPNVVGLRTFSKAYSLAGVRVGYCFGAVPIIEALNKVAIPFSVSSVAQAGAVASLRARDELAERVALTVTERERLSTALGTIPSEANFVWLPASSLPRPPAEIASVLADRGVLVRAFPEGIRITATTAEETDKLLEAWDF
ncbi:Putative phenylalanine aminotransferase [Corynebacterium kalinowskii]|uniref:Histidinol-phosphate aminotransferase n=1 Tax=Corynebacterium kalinowskii TaxID=2675216 RepID=A0A6B8VGA5_9CORY|nr:pyridoxal phosphate-dependent aminotransferase [Corynebacterium kalinowskii]QGU03173.1 Putative phenylalanine aminotransferase [Corynebacterium kalinowskii]